MLEASDREIYPIDIVPTPSSRRPFGEYTSTLAMHWDRTYRDRIAGPKSGTGNYWEDYWNSGDYSESILPSYEVAKHLESREETDHRLGYLSDNERELLSDLQHQQF